MGEGAEHSEADEGKARRRWKNNTNLHKPSPGGRVPLEGAGEEWRQNRA